MNTCEHLVLGKCAALRTAKGGGWQELNIEHLPKLAVLETWENLDGAQRWRARCLAAEDQKSQLQCEDFNKKREHFSVTNQY